MAQSTRRSQPPWKAPNTAETQQQPRLSVYNSLTRTKVPFVTLDPKGDDVTWYTCGPTVYDDAHTGHARNYVSTDIIRRILSWYFKYNVKFVMNVTDVDDKIIVKAREEKLFQDFKRDVDPESGRQIARGAFQAYADQKLVGLKWSFEQFPVEAQEYYATHIKSMESLGKPKGDDEAKMEMHIRSLTTAHQALSHSSDDKTVLNDDFFDGVRDVVKPFLDKRDGHKFEQHDHEPFNYISRKYEDRFFEDMDRLNVLRPDVLTRVTEYSDQIVQYVQRIVDSGFAYNVDGSIYFDIEAFEKAGKPYARLRPENRGDSELQAEGEGALSKGGNKRSKSDFALWKVSKPGEPAWSSPWGDGRPGWHIECSAMASDHFGQSMDIHSGGVDLAFPHHDNELAQSEAYWHKNGNSHTHDHQWVNYFLHMGHLTNKGQKMSKSLKNFTTIREALKTWSPRSLRIVYLLGSWNQPMEITDDMLKDSDSWEKTVNNFFLKAKVAERSQESHPVQNGNHSKGVSASDTALNAALSKAQGDMHEALADSFDTPRAMHIIRDLISKYNSTEKASLSSQANLAVARHVTKMVNVFGLDAQSNSVEEDKVGWSGIEIAADIREDVYHLSELRDELRLVATKAVKARKNRTPSTDQSDTSMAEAIKSLSVGDGSLKLASSSVNKAKDLIERFKTSVSDLAKHDASMEQYLQLTDTVRDDWLWKIGVYLEDAAEEGQPAVVRPLDNDLIAAREQTEKVSQDKADAKTREQQKKAKLDAEREAKARVDPIEMFQIEERRKEFSAWDVDGIPTKDEKGEDLTKNKAKKVRKEWETQKKAHDAFKQKHNGTS